MSYVLCVSVGFLLGFMCGALLIRAAREEDSRANHPTWRDGPDGR